MSPLVFVVIFLLLVAAFLLFTESRREQKLLLDRAQAQAVRFAQAADEIEPTIIAPAPPRQGLVTRLRRFLGLAEGQLTSRRIPLAIVVVGALVVGGVAAWQASIFFGIDRKSVV